MSLHYQPPSRCLSVHYNNAKHIEELGVVLLSNSAPHYFLEASQVKQFADRKDGFLQSNTPVKTGILNEQFQSVFTKEDTDIIPDKGPIPFTSMHEITINSNVLKKILNGLKSYKVPGPDGIPPSTPGLP